jgi:hypothetical protein
MSMSFPIHLTDWKAGRLILLWPDKFVSTKAISRELNLGARMLRRYVRRLGLGRRPIGTYAESKVARPTVKFGPLLHHPGTRA